MLKGSKVAKIEAVDQKVKADCVIGLTDQLHPGEGVEIEARQQFWQRADISEAESRREKQKCGLNCWIRILERLPPIS